MELDENLLSLVELLIKKIESKAESIDVKVSLRYDRITARRYAIKMHIFIMDLYKEFTLLEVAKNNDGISVWMVRYGGKAFISKDDRYNLKDIEVLSDLASQTATTIKIGSNKINEAWLDSGQELSAVVSGIKKQMYG